MKKIFLMWVLVFPLAVIAQSTSSRAEILPMPSVRHERNRLQVERTDLDARYEKESAVCHTRFAVTDCLRDVRVRRRIALDGLRRQEMALNQVERQRKATEQIKRIEARFTGQSKADSLADHPVQSELVPREARTAQAASATIRTDTALSNSNRIAKNTGGSVSSAVEAANKKQQYQDKIKRAQERRIRREKSNHENAKISAKSLSATP